MLILVLSTIFFPVIDHKILKTYNIKIKLKGLFDVD